MRLTHVVSALAAARDNRLRRIRIEVSMRRRYGESAHGESAQELFWSHQNCLNRIALKTYQDLASAGFLRQQDFDISRIYGASRIV